MKTKKAIFIGVTLLLTISLMLPLGCAKETSTPTGLKTYSKYGFSFDYPKEFSVTEMGLLQDEANDYTGLILVGIGNGEVQAFQITWLQMIPSAWEAAGDLQSNLDTTFVGIQTAEGIASVDSGELVETTKAGHQILYQYYTMTLTDGDKVYGIAAVFYCDGSQKSYQLFTANSTISAKHDVLEDFMNYLDSFVCH